jgi:hypothetical protein
MRMINMTVETCSECPFCHYDSNYSRSYDSGYDCRNGDGGRIIDDWEWDNTNNPKRLNLKHNGISIPDWCKLQEVGRKQKLEKLLTKIKTIK